MSPARAALAPSDAALRAMLQLAGGIGAAIRDERRRRRWTLRELATRAGVSVSHLHEVEAGRPASLLTYARIIQALGLRSEWELVDPRRKESVGRRDADPVHAAMGELEVTRLRALGRRVAIDEPYQHYQFAGRGDVVAWDLEDRALLHLENRTGFPDLQAAFGSYNAKRAYLGAVLAGRLGLQLGWRSETHAMVGLWSGEVMHSIRLRRESFASVCPDPVAGFAAWWAGELPPSGTSSTLLLLDPTVPPGSRRRTWIDRDALPAARARFRDYRETAEALRSVGRA